MNNYSDKNALKIVLIGNSRSGKTSLLTSYVNNEFLSDYKPTVFEHYSTYTMIEGIHYHVTFSDTSGKAEYDKLRPLDYTDTDVFLVCFSVVEPSSLEDVRHKWLPEMLNYSKDTPFLLVGTHTDLRHDGQPAFCSNTHVTKSQGKLTAIDIGAAKYVECSALTQDGLADVFDISYKTALHYCESKDKCRIM